MELLVIDQSSFRQTLPTAPRKLTRKWFPVNMTKVIPKLSVVCRNIFATWVVARMWFWSVDSLLIKIKVLLTPGSKVAAREFTRIWPAVWMRIYVGFQSSRKRCGKVAKVALKNSSIIAWHFKCFMNAFNMTTQISSELACVVTQWAFPGLLLCVARQMLPHLISHKIR